MDPRLDYLHDADVASVTFDGWPVRSICVRVSYHPDAGNSDLNGRQAAVWLRDVWASRYVLWPVHGQETLDYVRSGVSANFVASCALVPSHDAVQVTLAFNSGAALEVVCGELILQVDGEPAAPSR